MDEYRNPRPAGGCVLWFTLLLVALIPLGIALGWLIETARH